VPIDPSFANVALLLHGDGANGSSTFVDSSSYANSVTAVNGAQIATEASVFGGASISLSASASYLSLPANSIFNFGTGDFCIEAWVKFNTAGDNAIVGGIGPTNGSLMIRRRSDGTLSLGRNLIAFDTSSSVLSWDTTRFYHLAVTRSSGTVYLFRDGAQIGSGANSLTYNLTVGSNSIWAIGASQLTANGFGAGSQLNGYIDDLRITKGIARYTANFTPPTAPFPDA
jgi:hypothetical protein